MNAIKQTGRLASWGVGASGWAAWSNQAVGDQLSGTEKSGPKVQPERPTASASALAPDLAWRRAMKIILEDTRCDGRPKQRPAALFDFRSGP